MEENSINSQKDIQKQPGSPPQEARRPSSWTLHINIRMAFTTGLSNEQGILAPGQFHSIRIKNTSWASNASLLAHKRKKKKKKKKKQHTETIWKGQSWEVCSLLQKEWRCFPFQNWWPRLNQRLSYILTDLRTMGLTGIRKETFELLKSTGIPCHYFC